MNDEVLWKKRFQLFMGVRLIGVLTFFAGVAIAFTDLVQPGGSRTIGAILAIVGMLDALVAPRLIKKSWERPGK
ncbi:MAG: hypothetical protein LOX97_06255 [Sphingomonas sp.]|nr:hypothetical protein [Sphingomonas sp.]